MTKHAAVFLKSYRTQVKAPSLSSLLEEMVADLERRQQMEKLAASVTAYYDSLSAEELREEAAWGELGESELTHTAA